LPVPPIGEGIRRKEKKKKSARGCAASNRHHRNKDTCIKKIREGKNGGKLAPTARPVGTVNHYYQKKRGRG